MSAADHQDSPKGSHMPNENHARRTLKSLLAEAREVQWQKSRTRVQDHDDEGGKPVGSPKSDPTADAALDPVRLKLRQEVRRAEMSLLHGGPPEWEASILSLSLALDRWAGK